MYWYERKCIYVYKHVDDVAYSFQVENYISISFSQDSNNYGFNVNDYDYYMILVYNDETVSSEEGSVSFG